MARKKSTAMEVITPVESLAVERAVSQATRMAGLSPWQRAQIEWKVKKQRGELIVELAELETQTVLAEAMITAQGRISAAGERAAAEEMKSALLCLLDGGHALDEALSESDRLSEDTRPIVAGAMLRVYGSYARKVETRAGSLA